MPAVIWEHEPSIFTGTVIAVTQLSLVGGGGGVIQVVFKVNVPTVVLLTPNTYI